MRVQFTRTILLLTALVTTIGLHAIEFQYLTVEQELSSNVVYQSLQDQYGLIWIATRKGIDRYDGTSLRHYDLPSESESLNAAYALFWDHQDQLWAGSSEGIFRYDRANDTFTALADKSNLPRNKINAIWMDREGYLWIGTAQGLAVIDPDRPDAAGTIIVPDELSGIRSLFQDSRGDMWVGSKDQVYRYQRAQNKWESLPELFPRTSDRVSPSLLALCFFEDQQQRIWIGTDNRAVWVIDSASRSIQSLSDLNPQWPNGAVRSINFWPNGEVVVGIDGSGLLSLGEDLRMRERFIQDPNQKKSLNDNGIYHIFRDREARYWISTYGGGINIYDPQRPEFDLIQHQSYRPNSLGNNFTRAILEDSQGDLWVGTEKGISRYQPGLDQWTRYFNDPGNPNLLGNNNVLSLHEDRQGYIWAGTYGGGVSRIDPQTGRTTTFRHRSDDPQTIGTDFVYTIYEDREGVFWFGGIRGALTSYTPATDAYQYYEVPSVYDIFEVKNGLLYFGTVNGLFRLEKASGDIRQVHLPGIPQRVDIISMQQTRDSTLWLGTEGSGLIALSPDGSTVKQYVVADGLPSNSVVGILEDDFHRLWLSTSHGLSCLDPAKGNFINFGMSDGIGNFEFNRQAFANTRDGFFLFGGQNGITRFHPDILQQMVSNTPTLVFTDFKLFNRSVVPNSEGSPLDQQINETSRIELRHNQNAFSFEFTAIDFQNPAKNKYTWRLDGFEADWSPPTSDPSAVYTNLNSGDYTFQVKVSPDGQQWSEARSIAITIATPFWLSGWAFVLYALIGGSITALLINYFRIRIKERHSEEKIRFFVNIAHDLRTPLTLIKGPIRDMQQDPGLPEALQPQIDLIDKNATRLHQLMTQLLDFQKAGLGKMEFQVREKDIVAYLREKTELFQPWAREKSIQLTFHSDTDQLCLYYDTDKLDKIIYNLLSNALKYTPDHGRIGLKVSQEKDTCSITLSDNGIGIPKDQQSLLFKRYTRATNAVNYQIPGSGVGLMLVYQLVKLHKGRIELSSEENAGTTIRIWLPLGRRHLEDHQILTEAPAVSVPAPAIIPEPKASPVIQEDGDAPTILVVEDHPEIRSYLTSNLGRHYRILEAEEGAKGLRLAREKAPDLIISDVMMPEIDGMSLCKQIKSNFETSHIPVILLTALQGTDYNIQGVESGADVYLEKPFELKVLEAYVKNLIALRIRLREKFLSLEEPQPQDFPNAREHAFIEQLTGLIHQHLENEAFTVDLLCQEIALSRPVLFRKLKALTGQNIQNFIRIIRLKKAKELLEREQLTVAEAAYKTGFSSPKYFSTSFRKHFGVKPSEVGG
ncbi:hybrid sensor histidine kinase/response regulator transcription factor [Flavilitoribacter nigricans]|uniref:histidine kinase n=1 Tax=Flavilitoribacter nigricans (strain ATCC 23147 / DSM 23189 / NBRC 102662 / NCIMB 1420 / SS-2) TaxID=1122177 RepID=A0A2D0NDI2_FLAN2|nr:hybrid sensor histidine kinase/response regulator transcription factor [Flavilitoribacter nigricans]PHN06552.1 hypothetical protein CRP01_09615 [Flavilitoribacter nigricans DSM 23189 = NBRC 102662]